MNSELPQLIGHYLHLNAMEQLAMTMGHREESLKIMADNQVDYVINYVFMNDVWQPNLIVT